MPAVTQQSPRLEQCDLGRVARVLTGTLGSAEMPDMASRDKFCFKILLHLSEFFFN